MKRKVLAEIKLRDIKLDKPCYLLVSLEKKLYYQNALRNDVLFKYLSYKS